jgi:hypothetical protein
MTGDLFFQGALFLLADPFSLLISIAWRMLVSRYVRAVDRPSVLLSERVCVLDELLARRVLLDERKVYRSIV